MGTTVLDENKAYKTIEVEQTTLIISLPSTAFAAGVSESLAISATVTKIPFSLVKISVGTDSHTCERTRTNQTPNVKYLAKQNTRYFILLLLASEI